MFAVRSSCGHAIVHLENFKTYGKITESKENKLFSRKERCAINVWEPYSYKFHFFLCSSVFYIAVNLYSLRVCFSMTCHSYFIFISLTPKEIFFTDQIFLLPAPCLFFVMHLLEVLEKVGWLLLFLGCLELRFLKILAVVRYT